MSIKSYHQQLKSSYNIPWAHRGHFLDRQIERCPYCSSRKIVKRGRRRTKHETVQLYQCQQCQKTFTPKILKGKQYPLKVIFDSLSFYNLGHTLIWVLPSTSPVAGKYWSVDHWKNLKKIADKL